MSVLWQYPDHLPGGNQIADRRTKKTVPMADPLNLRTTVGYPLRVLTAGVALLIVGLAGCSRPNVRPGSADYPHVNPTPRRWILIHGAEDPALHLRFSTGWISNDSRCYQTNGLQGATGPYTASMPLPVKRTGATYSLRVPIDGYLSGRCNWRFTGIGFGPADNGESILLATPGRRLLPPGKSVNESLVLRCRTSEIGNNRLLFCAAPKRPNFLFLYPETRDLEVDFVADGP